MSDVFQWVGDADLAAASANQIDRRLEHVLVENGDQPDELVIHDPVAYEDQLIIAAEGSFVDLDAMQ